MTAASLIRGLCLVAVGFIAYELPHRLSATLTVLVIIALGLTAFEAYHYGKKRS